MVKIIPPIDPGETLINAGLVLVVAGTVFGQNAIAIWCDSGM
jgi:hypothetical protein